MTLRVAQPGDGLLWAVFADVTSGDTSLPFRFLHPAPPDAEGRTTVDFNPPNSRRAPSPTTSSARSRHPATDWTW